MSVNIKVWPARICGALNFEFKNIFHFLYNFIDNFVKFDIYFQFLMFCVGFVNDTIKFDTYLPLNILSSES